MIGSSVARREDPRLLTGRGRFTDDLQLPGCCTPSSYVAGSLTVW
ncbi:hypothetical protein NKH18_15425 [Streptomyces sp. M10(2022)]